MKPEHKIFVGLVIMLVAGSYWYSTNIANKPSNEMIPDPVPPKEPVDEAAPVSEVPDVMPDQPTETVGEERRVPTLNMSNQGLLSAPMAIYDHDELVVLNLSHNKLSGALPSQVGQLKNLERLDLSYNQFTGVPAEVGQLSKLRYLDLSHNELTGLPYELGNLQNLRTLILTGNDYAEQDLAVIREKLPSTVRIVL